MKNPRTWVEDISAAVIDAAMEESPVRIAIHDPSQLVVGR